MLCECHVVAVVEEEECRMNEKSVTFLSCAHYSTTFGQHPGFPRPTSSFENWPTTPNYYVQIWTTGILLCKQCNLKKSQMLCEFFRHLYTSALPKVRDSNIQVHTTTSWLHVGLWQHPGPWKPLRHPQPHAPVLVDGPGLCGSQFSFLLVDSFDSLDYKVPFPGRLCSAKESMKFLGTVFLHFSTQVHAILYMHHCFPARFQLTSKDKHKHEYILKQQTVRLCTTWNRSVNEDAYIL